MAEEAGGAGGAGVVEGRDVVGKYAAIWESADGSRMFLAGTEALFETPEEAGAQAAEFLWPMAVCGGLKHKGEIVRLAPDAECVPHSITHNGQTAHFIVLSGPLFDSYEEKPGDEWFYQ